MRATWWGGPFDGTTITVGDDATSYAVAYDENNRRVSPWPALQRYTTDPERCDITSGLRGVHTIVVYPVVNGYIIFGEKRQTIYPGESA